VDELESRDGPHERPSVPPSGTLLRRLALGSEAIYRVLGENERGVEVEVVDAPGLQPGSRFTFTVADVVAMTGLSESERAAYAVRPGVPRRRFA
jgi:hypothetical protein